MILLKTVFIINPGAGKGKETARLEGEIAELRGKYDIEVYKTKGQGDATRFVENYCLRRGVARFIACGGDGTFSEVVNAAVRFPGASAGVIPSGTGNDFCRNFEKMSRFLDVEGQVTGKPIKCDIIKYSSAERNGYCVNMVNIGFDCNVADTTDAIKRKKLANGSFAYFLSIIIMLIKKKGAEVTVNADGKRLRSGRILLNSIANGCCCGGGIKSNPDAVLNDGQMDINIVYNISRLNFLSKLPFYMKGTHRRLKNIEKCIYTQKCKQLTVTPCKGTMRMCVDGEIFTVGETVFEIVPGGFEFILP